MHKGSEWWCCFSCVDSDNFSHKEWWFCFIHVEQCSYFNYMGYESCFTYMGKPTFQLHNAVYYSIYDMHISKFPLSLCPSLCSFLHSSYSPFLSSSIPSYSLFLLSLFEEILFLSYLAWSHAYTRHVLYYLAIFPAHFFFQENAFLIANTELVVVSNNNRHVATINLHLQLKHM